MASGMPSPSKSHSNVSAPSPPDTSAVNVCGVPSHATGGSMTIASQDGAMHEHASASTAIGADVHSQPFASTTRTAHAPLSDTSCMRPVAPGTSSPSSVPFTPRTSFVP